MLLINAIRIAPSILSMIGSGFIIFSYIFLKSVRTPALKLVFWLSIADFFMAASVAVQSIYVSNDTCGWFAAWEYSFCISTYCWVCCIAVNMLQYDKNKKRLQSMEKYYLLFGWGIPLGCTTFLLIKEQFGLVVAWQNCWIINAWDNPYYYAFYFVPLCFTYLWLIICFVYLMRKMKRMGAPVELRAEVRKSAISYLAVFAFSWLNIWTSTTLVPLVGPFPLWFVEVGSFMYPFQGFLNALVYGFTGSIRHRYMELLCGFKKPKDPEKTGLINSTSSGNDEEDQ